MTEGQTGMSNDISAASSATHALVLATERLCDLPGIATQDWCDRAAAAFALLAPGPVVASIGELNGDTMRVEAYGVAGARATPDVVRALAARYRENASFDWGAGEPSDWNARVQTMAIESLDDQDLARSKAAKQWREAGASGVVVGAARYSPQDERRVLTVEIGCVGSAASWFPSILRLSVDAAMRPAMRRANMAFGAEAIVPSRMLTSREQEILDKLTLGLSVRVIAAELDRSPHTVHDHVKSLHRKLNASSRGQLIARALGHAEAFNSTKAVRLESEDDDTESLGAAFDTLQ
jgi:DNA-binding CsgD family transcriptional regulator